VLSPHYFHVNVPSSNFGQDTFSPDYNFRGFTKTFQAIAKDSRYKLGNNLSLAHPLQFIV
jgi:hypothetical protein